MPEKPKFGMPCNGCGLCCQLEVCKLGLDVYGDDAPTPCPGLRWRDGRSSCRLVEMAEELSPDHGIALRSVLGVGIGCDSEVDGIDDARPSDQEQA